MLQRARTIGSGPRVAVWNALTGAVATLAGVAPHVLHHLGLLAGAALASGVTGNLLFGLLGLLLSVPLLRRLYRRFRTWRAPAVAVAVFAVMFSISAFVIGPAIGGTEPAAPVPDRGGIPGDHAGHHG
jgi:hypothetical protein